MIKSLEDFASKLDAEIHLDERLVVGEGNRYFALGENLTKLVGKGFFYAGTYLGKTKEGRFFPSFNLLRMIASGKANKVVVDAKTEWLFICGRDVFKQGIVKVIGSSKRGSYTLVLNQRGECMGFGRILCDLDKEKEVVAIKNVLDIGDFLRREKQQP
jgi:ribosome biogenesis protein Nip4